MGKRKKNYWLTLFFGLFFWLIFGFIILYIEPEWLKDYPFPSQYAGFFIVLFLALFFPLAILTNSSLKGFYFSLAVIIFLILRLHHQGNLLNFILIVLILFSIDYYFTHRN